MGRGRGRGEEGGFNLTEPEPTPLYTDQLAGNFLFKMCENGLLFQFLTPKRFTSWKVVCYLENSLNMFLYSLSNLSSVFWDWYKINVTTVEKANQEYART
jgi:hypothetical protein